jgi:prepilin-type processing-associated H-X9-DG protein
MRRSCTLRARGRGITLLDLLAIVFIVAILGVAFFPVFSSSGPPRLRSVCLSNVKQMTLGILLYSNDNSDAAPSASRWMDQDAGYTKSGDIYRCPYFQERSASSYGYAMRTKLGGVDLDALKNANKEPICFDTELTGRNAHTNQLLIPLFTRHSNQSVGFADGHAKSIRRRQSNPD